MQIGEGRQGQESQYPAATVGWSAVSIFTALYILSFVDRKLLSLMVAPIQRDLQITDFEFGLLQGFAFSLLYVLAGIPIGRLVDRHPRRLIIYVGVTFWSFAAAASGFAQNFLSLLLARFGVAVGEATLSPSAYSMMSDLFPRDRLSTALGVYGMGVTIGGGIAYALGGWIISLLSGSSGIDLGWLGSFRAWQLAFLITGVPGVLLAFIIFMIPEPRRTGLIKQRGVGAGTGDRADDRAGTLTAFLSSRRKLLFCHFLGFSMIAIWSFSVSSWAPAFFIRSFGWEPWKIGIGLAIYTGIFGTISVVAGGRLVDWCLRRGMADAHLRIPLYSAVLAVPFGVAAFLVDSPLLSIALLSAMQLFLMVFTGPAVGALQVVTPNELRGQISAIYLFVVSLIGFGAGPVIVGGITDFWFGDPAKVGWSLAMLILCCGPAAAILLALGLSPMRHAAAIADRWS